jgi:hypothetical protein
MTSVRNNTTEKQKETNLVPKLAGIAVQKLKEEMEAVRNVNPIPEVSTLGCAM